MSNVTVRLTTANIEEQRTADLAKDLFGALSGITGLDEAKKDALAASQAASGAAETGRVGALLAAARISQQHQLTDTDINRIASKAVTLFPIESRKAMSTFMSDVRTAMHANVRGWADDIRDIVTEVFEAEKADKGKGPCTKAFSRPYHMMTAAFRAAKDEGRVIVTFSDAVEFATDRNPDVNPDKALKELAKMAETLERLNVNFPGIEAIAGAMHGLNEIVKDTLLNAREGLMERQEAATNKASLAPLPPGSVTPVVETPAGSVTPVVETPAVDELAEAEAVMDGGVVHQSVFASSAIEAADALI